MIGFVKAIAMLVVGVTMIVLGIHGFLWIHKKDKTTKKDSKKSPAHS